MVQGCPELRFPVEALLYVDRAVGMQALDGHLTAQTLVLTEENGGHAAGAEVPDDPVPVVEK
jgi:hypothetical protein